MTHNPPDNLNDLGVLKRREIEARILTEYIEALAETFDREQLLAILKATIINVARTQGASLAKKMGGEDLVSFAETLPAWTKDNALEIEVLEQSLTRFSFNVKRCRYAEMYHALGIPELGEVLSCNRDFSLIEGFNPEITLTRTQTIMNGAECCDFRYEIQKKDE